MEGIAAAGVVLVLGIALKVLAGVVLLGIGVAFAVGAFQKWKAGKDEPVAASGVACASVSPATISSAWQAILTLLPLILEALSSLKDDSKAQVVCKALLEGIERLRKEAGGIGIDTSKLPIPLTGNIVADLSALLTNHQSKLTLDIDGKLKAFKDEIEAKIEGLLHKGS